MVPAIKATSAESSDHPNPGACRPLNVETRPTIPAMRNSHPRKTVATMPAINGKMIAASPSRIKAIPSPRYRPQWSCIDLVRAADTLELADDRDGDMARSFVPDVILVLLRLKYNRLVGVSADSLDIARRIGERDGETFSDRPKTGVSDNDG